MQQNRPQSHLSNNSKMANFKAVRLRYRFELKLVELHLKIPAGCTIYVEWSKKNKKIKEVCLIHLLQQHKSYEKFKIQSQNNMILEQTLYFKQKSGKQLIEKQNVIKIILLKDNLQKLGGKVKFDLGQIVQLNSSSGQGNFSCRIQNCPDAQGLLKFKVYYQLLKQQAGMQRSISPGRLSPSELSSRSKMSPKILSPSRLSPRFLSPGLMPTTCLIGKLSEAQTHRSSRQEIGIQMQSPKAYNQPVAGDKFQQIKMSSLALKYEKGHDYRKKSDNYPVADKQFDINFKLQNSAIQTQRILQQEKRINQLLSVITGFKNQVHLKAKQIQVLRDQLSVLKQQLDGELIQSGQKVISSFKEINSLVRENKTFKMAITLKQEEIQKLKLAMLRVQRRNTQLQIKCESYIAKKEQLQAQNRRILASVENSSTQTKNQLFQAQSVIFKLQQQIKGISSPDQHLLSRLHKLQFENITMSRQLRQTQQQLIESKHSHEQLVQKLSQVSVSQGILKQKLVKVQKAHAKEQELSAQAYAIMRQKYETIKNELEEKSIMLDQLEHNQDCIRKEKDKEVQFLRKKFDSLRRKLDSYES